MQKNLSNRLLDRYAEREGLTSDYQIAKSLQITSQHVYAIRGGKSKLGVPTAVQIAESLTIDPMTVIAKLEVEKARQPRIVEVMSKYAGRVLLAVVAAIALAGPSEVEAATYAHNV